ncbi:hypothetical protein, partial [Rhizobium sp. 12,4]|uniref:hypothetical protein n=1 Tax=Rhizobium sp. 12,4 TaxID=3405135 RepID=UPI003D327A52
VKGFWLAVRNRANLLPDLAVLGIRFRRTSINRFDGEAMTYMGSRQMKFQGACLPRTALASLPGRKRSAGVKNACLQRRTDARSPALA